MAGPPPRWWPLSRPPPGAPRAVATAGLVDDPDRTEGFRILAGGETTPTLADAIRMLEPETVPQRDGSDGLVSHVLAGASIASSLDRLTCQVDHAVPRRPPRPW
jgi:hypothetical protein